MSQHEQEAVSCDPLFQGMTRPPMTYRVTYTYFMVNLLLTTMVFLVTGALWAWLLAVPIHFVGVLACMKDPRFFDLWFIKLTQTPPTRNWRFWQAQSYSPSPGRAAPAVGRTGLGTPAQRETSLADFVPYTHHVDDTTIATRNGDLVTVLQLDDGFSFETADQAELNSLKQIRNDLWRGLEHRVAIYHHILRRWAPTPPTGEFQGFCNDLDQAWRQRLSDARLFLNQEYVTLVLRPWRGPIGWLDRIRRLASAKVDRAAFETEQARTVGALHETAEHVLKTLAAYGARRLGRYDTPTGPRSEAMEMLHYLLNQKSRPLRVPTQPLHDYLPCVRPFFGSESVELRGPARDDVTFGAMLSIKEYGPETSPGMLDPLLRLPHEFVLTQSFSGIERQSALDSLQRTQRVMVMSGDRALTQQEELTSAMDATAGGLITWGEHHLTLFVKGPTPAALDRAVTDATSELTMLGLQVLREDLTQEACYMAQLPGNFAYRARTAKMSSANFASFGSFHNFPAGRLEGNHWGPCVTVLETTSGTPHAFNLHHGDVGNFTLLGPTGKGKTVILGFLLAQAQRFKPRTVYFDKDRGAEIFLRAIGGHYSVLAHGTPTGLNPWQLSDTEINRGFLRELVACLVAEEHPLTAEERLLIAQAVEENFHVPRPHRRLRVFQELLAGHELPGPNSLAARLAPWHSDGERAWLFDNEHDQLSLDQGTIGLDLTTILDDPISRVPALMYLFHRVDALFTGAKTIVFLDEAWKALDDPAFAARIKDWLKTLRKRNGVLGLGAQSAGDLLKSGIADTLLEQCPTQLFLPNPKADSASYGDGCGLTREEVRLLRVLPDRCFLIKHGLHSVVARLDLSGMDDLLAVLSGRTETVQLLDDLRAEVGDDPNAWLPLFHQRRNV